MSESEKNKEVLIATLGAEVQEIAIATQLLLQQQRALVAVVVLYPHTLQNFIPIIQETFEAHPRWPHLHFHPMPVDALLEPSQFDLFANTLYTEVKGWLDCEHRIHLLLANGCRAMTAFGMSVAQILLGDKDYVWYLNLANCLRQSGKVQLAGIDQAELCEISCSHLMLTPVRFTYLMEQNSFTDAIASVKEKQQAHLHSFVKKKLTLKEREISTLLAIGLSNAEIANKLHTSEKNVKKRISQIYKKLGQEFTLQSRPKLKREFLAHVMNIIESSRT